MLNKHLLHEVRLYDQLQQLNLYHHESYIEKEKYTYFTFLLLSENYKKVFAGSYFVTFWLLKDKHNFIYKKKAFKRLLYCFKNIPVVSLRKLSETLPIPYKVMRSMLENNRLHWPPRPIKHQLKRTFYPSPTISEIGPESPNLYSRRSFRVQILMTND